MAAEKRTSTPPPAFRVFVSSTYTDMLPFRDAVRNALNKADCIACGMERFGADSRPPLDVCYDELEKCQIYVCVLGMRYGTIDTTTEKSYTQLEYERAESSGLPILAFLIDEKEAKIGIQDIDFELEPSTKLKQFKNRIKNSKTVTCDFFSSPSDLGSKVYQAVMNEIKRLKDSQSKGKNGSEAYIEGARLFRKFVRRPLRYRNQDVVLRVRFDGVYGGWALKEELFEAFGFEPGAAVYLNDLYVLGSDVDVGITDWVVDCFAEDSAADWLDDNDVTVGTIFEGRFRLAYEHVKNLSKNDSGRVVGVAKMVLLEGIQVISRGVPVLKKGISNAQQDLF